MNILQYRFRLAAPVPFGTDTPDRFFSRAMALASAFDDEIALIISNMVGETAMDYLGFTDDDTEVIVSDACPKDKIIHPYYVGLY
jgi:hypothetical protein